jgi:hypothetical protein
MGMVVAPVAAMHEKVHQRTGEDEQKRQGGNHVVGVPLQEEEPGNCEEAQERQGGP